MEEFRGNLALVRRTGGANSSTAAGESYSARQKRFFTRVWQRAGLQPHRMRRYVASNDSDFESNAAAIIQALIDSVPCFRSRLSERSATVFSIFATALDDALHPPS
jgi:hypothetical protein